MAENSGEGRTAKEVSYFCRKDTAEVVKNNTLMNGITSTRGEAFGMLQEDVLTLQGNGERAEKHKGRSDAQRSGESLLFIPWDIHQRREQGRAE